MPAEKRDAAAPSSAGTGQRAAVAVGRRGPRRTPAAKAGSSPADVDLGALKAALLAAVAEHHPSAALDRGRGSLRPRGRGACDPAAGDRRAVRHASHRVRPDRRRPWHRPDRRPGGAAPRRPRGHRVQPDRRRGALRRRGRPPRGRRDQALPDLDPQRRAAQAENLRKMFLAMAEDIRVVLIKLGDRLHNMRTLDGMPPDKQQRIARETMEIYAPLADRLGIWQIKWELEDLAFRHLRAGALPGDRAGSSTRGARAASVHRPGHRRVAPPSSRRRASRPTSRPRQAHLQHLPEDAAHRAQSSTRSTTCCAIRVLVDDVRDCYNALGVVHGLWRPIPGQFDDYIAIPKENLYQSLHTTVMALDGAPRGADPHARDAPARRVRHRRPLALQGRREARPRVRRKLAWLRQLMDWQRDVSESDATSSSSASRPTSSRTRSSSSRPRARSRTCPPAPRRSTSPTASTPTSATARRREGQRPARPAGLPSEERRHRRDRHDQVRARAVARLAQPRPGPATPARRSASGSSARSATRTSTAAARRWSASYAGWLARHSPRSARTS